MLKCRTQGPNQQFSFHLPHNPRPIIVNSISVLAVFEEKKIWFWPYKPTHDQHPHKDHLTHIANITTHKNWKILVQNIVF